MTHVGTCKKTFSWSPADALLPLLQLCTAVHNRTAKSIQQKERRTQNLPPIIVQDDDDTDSQPNEAGNTPTASYPYHSPPPRQRSIEGCVGICYTVEPGGGGGARGASQVTYAHQQHCVAAACRDPR
jgi:hypothetical protein